MSCLPVTRTIYSTPTSVQTILTTTFTAYARPETVTTVCFGDYTDERAKRGRHQYPRQDDCSEGFDEQVISSIITLDPQIVTEPLVITELITSIGAPIPVETQDTALCAPETGIAVPDTTATNTLATGSLAPAIDTLPVPQYSPTDSHPKTKKVGIVVGSIAAAVVVIAIVVSLVCYVKFRGKGGGGPRTRHSYFRSVRAELDLSAEGAENSEAGHVFGQAPLPLALSPGGGVVGSSNAVAGGGTSILGGTGEGFGGQRPSTMVGFEVSYPPPYIPPPQASQTSPYIQSTVASADVQKGNSSYGQQGSASTPPTTWTNSNRQREQSRLTVDTSSSSSLSSRQSSVGGMGWIDQAYASQSSIDKPAPWLNQSYGPYAGLARVEKPRRTPRPSRTYSFDARTSGATQPVSPPSREETSRQGSATSVSAIPSPGQRRIRPLPAIPGTVPRSSQPAQGSATPTVLAQPSPLRPSTAAQGPFNVETGPPNSNQLPPGYYQTER